ncbi:hypothetical protein A2765_04365 [Candidatus Kaiserbacteria bacterium RIFCSPHIGHO2_01_FULL_56_24]|uniref:DUF4430 domain-containing protein n=1 Tax=Candidatus Kaiserbacteria bacterium RIFCSPHIGHO2_01_FULL_56_24 TaxID=1798487 RepID=A0A1F6DED3_9BACT|nr:MAG: hypothetical protein A2765_04365 [Candidatus Kaiserbacteria bacterium RIFCSPHIGHO2_01_FULL_56_24]
MKNIKTSYIIIGVIVLFIGGIGLSRYLQSNNPNTASTGAFHWHPSLTIYVKGQRQEIPANIGIGAVHQPMHTHSEDASQGVIHLEFAGAAKNDEIKLSRFLQTWGKDITSFGTNMTMTVNGKPNTEFGDYVFKDGDKVELRYE